MLKVTGVKLQLLTDLDMILFFEKGVRGAISNISTKYSKANNKYMGEKYNPNEASKYITYLDANNPYSWACPQGVLNG